MCGVPSEHRISGRTELVGGYGIRGVVCACVWSKNIAPGKELSSMVVWGCVGEVAWGKCVCVGP